MSHGTQVRQDRHEDAVPAPDHPAKPQSPTELDHRSWKYVGRKVLREFSEDQCTDQAAALTYYAVLAVFPAALALLSLLGVVGQADEAVDTMEEVLGPLVSPGTLSTVMPVFEEMATSQAAGVTLVIGLLGALWSASGYVGAFGRAMNRVYEIGEGRPFWKLRPMMMLVTLVAVLLAATILVMLVVSGPLAETIGGAVGLGSESLTVWNIAKWPVVAVMVVVVVALLYYATPNIQQPRFRWISLGAAVAIVIWVLASIGFAFYVANFSNYGKTYGSIAGVVVALLWLWLTNIALLLGAEIDSEVERGRELQAGIPAESELQLPARDTRNIDKAREQEEKDIELGRRIRERADPDGELATDPEPSPAPALTAGAISAAPISAAPISAAPTRAAPTRAAPAPAAPAITPAQQHSAVPALVVGGVGAAGFLLGTTVSRLIRKE